MAALPNMQRVRRARRAHWRARGGGHPGSSHGPLTASPPPLFVPVTALYLLYAQLEEEWGLARHAMAVYERATRAVEPSQQYDMFNIYIKRAAEIYGVTHTRGIYQKAIEVPTAGGGAGGWGREEKGKKGFCRPGIQAGLRVGGLRAGLPARGPAWEPPGLPQRGGAPPISHGALPDLS